MVQLLALAFARFAQILADAFQRRIGVAGNLAEIQAAAVKLAVVVQGQDA